jgi:spermidine synthase
LPQLGVFTDGDNMTVITKAADNNQQLAYLDQVTSAVPYHLRTPGSVLVVGAGGGADILQALYHATEQGNEMEIDAVELNAQLLDIVGHRFSDFNGGLYQRPDVQLYAADVRGFL